MQLEKTLPLTVFWCAWRSSFATTNVSPFRMNFMASLSFGRSASTLESCSQKSQAGGTATRWLSSAPLRLFRQDAEEAAFDK
jgi:hypothetical protein